MSISVAVKGLQVAVSFGRSGRGPFPGSGNPGSEKRCEDEKRSAIVIRAEYEAYPERRGEERRRW